MGVTSSTAKPNVVKCLKKSLNFKNSHKNGDTKPRNHQILLLQFQHQWSQSLRHYLHGDSYPHWNSDGHHLDHLENRGRGQFGEKRSILRHVSLIYLLVFPLNSCPFWRQCKKTRNAHDKLLAIIGVLGLLAYLFIFYFRHPKGLRTGETELFWVFIGSCMKILFSVWYILVIHGAFKEAKQRDNTGGIVYSPGNPELGQPIPMQPMGQPVGYVAVPTQAAPPPYQPSAPQVYPDLPQK